MLHIRALRGFVPTDLVIDYKGYIPLPGDAIEHFRFSWFTNFSQPIYAEEQSRIFRCWCDKNVVIVGRTMVMLAKWKDAITVFQTSCDAERERRQANLSKFWRVDFTHSEGKSTT